MKRLYSSILLSLSLNTSLIASHNSGGIDLFERAPMPGMITAIQVKPGDSVQKGDVLFRMEAMKMETLICAGTSGIVGALNFKNGDNVESGDVLFNYDDPSLEIAVLAAVGSNNNPPSDGGNNGGSSGTRRNSDRNGGSSGSIDFSQPCYFNGYRWVQGHASDSYYDGFEWLSSPPTSIKSSFEAIVGEENVVSGNEQLVISEILDNSSFISSDASDLNTVSPSNDFELSHDSEVAAVDENVINATEEFITTTLNEKRPVQFHLADSVKWIEYPQYASIQTGLSEKTSRTLKSNAFMSKPSHQALFAELRQTHDDVVIAKEPMRLRQSFDSIVMNMDGKNNSLTLKGAADEFSGSSQVSNKHNVQFVENEPIEKSFFQMLTKYIYETLFDPTVGLLVSLMVMFYSMTSFVQSLAPLFVQRMSGLVRIRA